MRCGVSVMCRTIDANGESGRESHSRGGIAAALAGPTDNGNWTEGKIHENSI